LHRAVTWRMPSPSWTVQTWTDASWSCLRRAGTVAGAAATPVPGAALVPGPSPSPATTALAPAPSLNLSPSPATTAPVPAPSPSLSLSPSPSPATTAPGVPAPGPAAAPRRRRSSPPQRRSPQLALRPAPSLVPRPPRRGNIPVPAPVQPTVSTEHVFYSVTLWTEPSSSEHGDWPFCDGLIIRNEENDAFGAEESPFFRINCAIVGSRCFAFVVSLLWNVSVHLTWPFFFRYVINWYIFLFEKHNLIINRKDNAALWLACVPVHNLCFIPTRCGLNCLNVPTEVQTVGLVWPMLWLQTLQMVNDSTEDFKTNI